MAWFGDGGENLGDAHAFTGLLHPDEVGERAAYVDADDFATHVRVRTYEDILAEATSSPKTTTPGTR